MGKSAVITQYRGFIFTSMNKRPRHLDDNLTEIVQKSSIDDLIACLQNLPEISITQLISDLTKRRKIQWQHVSFVDVPHEVMEYIFRFLDISTHMQFGRLSRSLYELSGCRTPEKHSLVVWDKHVHMKHTSEFVLQRIAKNVPTSSLSCEDITTCNMDPLEEMPQLQKLSLRLDREVCYIFIAGTDKLKFLRKLPSLTDLELHNVHASDDCLSNLIHVKTLTRLAISTCVSGSIMDTLVHLHVLRRLELGATDSISVDDFSRMSDIPSLRELVYTNTNITDDHLFHLRSTKLTELIVPINRLTHEGFSHLINLPLETLDVAFSSINWSRRSNVIVCDNKIADSLNKLGSTLRILRIAQSKLDDSVISQLRMLPNLVILEIVPLPRD